jgi:hypothetical protein
MLKGRRCAMAVVDIRPGNREQIDEQVEAVRRQFGEDVVRIRYSFSTNHWGDPAIFFRIVLKDEVANNSKRLSEVSDRLSWLLDEQLRLDESDWRSYYNFRSQSELNALQDPAWA